MFRTSFTETDRFIDRTSRVLICLSNERDGRLLADQLESGGGDVEVVFPSDYNDLPQFDLCVLDTETYPLVAETVERRRSGFGVVYLPILLVVAANESEHRHEFDHVDEVLEVPSSKAVFQRRVDALLRIKSQSEQLALFGRAMDDATAGITIADADGDQELRYVNDAFLEITGYDRGEALGRNCRFLQGPETDPAKVRRIRRAIDDREPVSVDIRNYRADGTLFWNHLEIAPVFGEDGVSHFVGFQEDITERVQQRRTLERYEEIVTAAGEPIYALDDDLRFTQLNEATAAFAGSGEAFVGAPVAAVFGENHAEVLAAAVLDLAETDSEQMTIGTVAEDASGRQRRLRTTVARLPTEEFAGVVCVSRDITEDRQRESRLSVLDRVLRHNLRNKLMVMLAQVEQIQYRTTDADVVESSRAIQRAGEELLDLAETARTFKDTVDPDADEDVGPMDVGHHTTHAIEETKLEWETATFLTDVPASQWALAHSSFELAMTELLERAAKAGERVKVVVDMGADDDEVLIRVSHDGTGLEEVELGALNTGVESDLQHTQGLGLWFVRWMAVNSGGTFHVADNDPGTTVELRLQATAPPNQ